MFMKRRTNFNRILAAALLLVCLMGVFAPCVQAAQDGVSGTVTVAQEFKYTNGRKPTAGEQFSYRITYLGDLAAGEEAKEVVKDFTLDGDAATTFGFSYEHAGIYQYRVEQVVEKERTNYVYDRAVYTIYAYCENVDEELTLRFVVTDEDGDKLDSIVYHNAYNAPAEGGTPHTGDTMRPLLWLAALLISGSAMLILVLVSRKKEEKQN